jgi:MFS family permease
MMAGMPTRLGAVVERLVPPTPLSRKLATQSLLFATGAGTFNTGSAVFFTQVVGLSAAKVGLGMTIAGVVSFLVAYPMGRLVDRIGARPMWAAGALVGALAFAVWPWLHGFGQYVVMSIAFEIVNNIGQAGYNAYVLNVLPEAERVETQAHLYSALNLGFTIGALIGGIALAFDNLTVIRWLPLLTTAIGLVNAARIMRLPQPVHEEPVTTPLEALVEEAADSDTPVVPGALRNAGWLGTTFFTGVLWTNQVLLNVVIPLWLVQRTDAPHWILAWLFGTNTVLCIFLPQFTSRGVATIGDALRRARWSTGFFVASCLITMATHSVTAFWAALLVWLGHVTVTGAELAIGSGTWAFQARLMDPRHRGEYGGAAEVARTLGQWWAPAVYTWLAMEQGDLGWMLIALIAVVATIGLHPSARAAERFAVRHFAPEPRQGRPVAH